MTALDSARSRTAVLRDTVQSQLWPVPTIGVILGLALGIVMPQLDEALDGTLSDGFTSYLFGGGADAARNVLNAITSSLITVTSLTFSLTVVTLQLASSQFSPRLLRTFARDSFVHFTLALFLSTFVYSLVVLRTIRTEGDSGPEFVPQMSVTLALLFTLASVVGLVLFLAHLASQIRVETMLDNVHDDASQTLSSVLQEREDDQRSSEVTPVPPQSARPVLTRGSGFLTAVEEDELLSAAVKADAVLLIEGLPGGSLVAGTPLGKAWTTDGGRLDDDPLDTLTDSVGEAVTPGSERTAAQDIAYGLRQMTDVAVKALSPGINDPTTAVYALGHSSALLCEATRFQLGPKLLRDKQGRVRVVLSRPGLSDLLDAAVAQPRRYGASAPNVLERLMELLREVAFCARDNQQRAAVADQLRRLRATIGEQSFGTTEHEALEDHARRVEQALAGGW